MHEQDTETVARFKRLFRGNPEAYGQYNTQSKKSETLRKPALLSDYENHLYGGYKGLGIIPVIDHTTSWFGVLDYDNHKSIDSVNLIKLEAAIRKIGAPLVVCRSKSGGAHVFLFGSTPLNTKILRQTMNNYAEQLSGFGEVEIEIFPKQDSVDKHLVGSWINLPYLNCLKTDRYAIIKGKRAGIREFLTYAESVSIDNSMLLELGSETHKEAPPCLEILSKERLGEGQRNVALYNWTVYTKKAFPENYDTLVYKFNAENFTTPLKHDEVTKVINSVTRGSEYRYKCSEEPCKSRCDSSKCVLRKFGITPTERNELVMATLPEFGLFKKYLTDPVVYEIEIEGKMLKLSSLELLNFHNFRRVVFEQLDRVIKIVKPEEWMTIVDRLVKKVELIEVPDDASRSGTVRSLLMEYIKQTNLKDSGKNIERRKLLSAGQPVVQELPDKKELAGNKRYVLFRGIDFRKYIQSKRLGNIVGADIYMAVKDMGVLNLSVRMPDKGGTLKVWGVPLIDDSHLPDIYDDDFDIVKKKPKKEEPDIDYSDVPEVTDVDDFKPEF